MKQVNNSLGRAVETTAARGTVYSVIGLFFTILSGYVVHVGVARIFGSELYGLFGIAISVLGWLEITISAGFPAAAKKFISENSQWAGAVTRITLKLQLLLSFFLFLVVFVLAPHISHWLQDIRLSFYLRVASLDLLVYGVYTLYFSILNGKRLFVQANLTLIIYSLSRLILIYLLVWLGLSLTGVFVGNVLASFVGLVVARSLSHSDKLEKEFSALRVIRFSLPTSLFILLFELLMVIDLLCVKGLIQIPEQAGFYTAAQAIAKIPYLFPMALSMTLFPSFSKAIARADIDLTKRYINQALRFVLMLSLPIVLIISAGAEGLISIIYSRAYSSAGAILSILAFGMLFLILLRTLTVVFIANGEPAVPLKIVMFLIPVDLFFNFLLIPQYGSRGAAFATTLTSIGGLIIAAVLIFERFHTLVNIPSLLRILVASLTGYLLLFLFSGSGIVF
ncbi:MAG: oligosaccharide flippase family protein, partial [candidate division WOR-3 bacterium]|nr:oligosaccharide flippase family protein [candidate division WOR-3 bacterium]